MKVLYNKNSVFDINNIINSYIEIYMGERRESENVSSATIKVLIKIYFTLSIALSVQLFKYTYSLWSLISNSLKLFFNFIYFYSSMQKYFKSALHCVDMPSSKEQPFSHKKCESFFNKYSGRNIAIFTSE